jgi:hypothetical protein
MNDRGILVRDPLGATLTGLAFGLTTGLLTWWGPIWHHVTSYATIVGVSFGFDLHPRDI